MWAAGVRPAPAAAQLNRCRPSKAVQELAAVQLEPVGAKGQAQPLPPPGIATAPAGRAPSPQLQPQQAQLQPQLVQEQQPEGMDPYDFNH